MKRLMIPLVLAGLTALSSAAVIFFPRGEIPAGALVSAPPAEEPDAAEEVSPPGEMASSEMEESAGAAPVEAEFTSQLWPRGRISAARTEDRLVHRFVVERNISSPPSPSEIIAEERTGAGPVVRFHTRGSRVEESEAYRRELQGLPAGHRWSWYQQRIQELGFRLRDAAWSGLERPHLSLEKNGLYFVLELSSDSSGRVLSISAGPNL